MPGQKVYVNFFDSSSYHPYLNEAPRSKLRGIKAELRRSHSNVKEIAELTRLRSDELRRGSPCVSSLQPRWAGSPLRYDKVQGITAKANKPVDFFELFH
jgi:hypothetical protein